MVGPNHTKTLCVKVGVKKLQHTPRGLINSQIRNCLMDWVTHLCNLGREQAQQVLSLDKMPPSWSSPVSSCMMSNNFHAWISVDLTGFGHISAAKLQLESFSGHPEGCE